MAKLYADHNVARGVVQLLRARGHSVTTTAELGLERAGDDVQVLTAAQRGWVMLTHNLKDFTLLHDAWRRWSGAWGVSPHHAGILIPPQRWSHQRVVTEVDALLDSGSLLLNELYEWHPSGGWARRP